MPTLDFYGNTDLPNQVKLGNSFKNIANIKFAIDDSIGLTINHITAIAGKGSFVRLGYREGLVAHLARERTKLLFCF